MKIKNKILLYFYTTTIALTIFSSLVIYSLFSEFREEEFQQRQKQKINYTIGLIAKYKEISENLISIMDKLTIHDFYDEKMLIYDKNKTLIYKSIDDLKIKKADKLLNSLSPTNPWIETVEDGYDIVAVYIENNDNQFYAISKAYDAFGYSKLAFLRKVLIGITFFISLIVLFLTIYLSKKISDPIVHLAEQLGNLNIADPEIKELKINTNSLELKYLVEKINELIKRSNETIAFQKHMVHHISHQLKTPIAVLVSELERIENIAESEYLKNEINTQIIKTKSLGNIINTLLEISKIETAKKSSKQVFRIDELIFDIIEELNTIHPDFKFEINYSPKKFSEAQLLIEANKQLIKQAFLNILSNSIAYSDNAKADILFDCKESNALKVIVSNSGIPISRDEIKYIFNYFFRGQNSQNKPGFGLGLVLAKKIIEIHNGKISYQCKDKNLNIFEIVFSLS